MPRSPSRVPPIWIVLVPLAVLAWMGVRAARNESEAARSRVAARAGAAAERMVRAIDNVAREFSQGLPPADAATSAADVLGSVRHLLPRWLATTDGRVLADDGTARDLPAAARAFLADALDAADRLGGDAAGLEAQAAFLDAAAAAAPDDGAALVLRAAAQAAARRLEPSAPQADDVETAGRIASDAFGLGAALRDRLADRVAGDDAPGQVRAVRARWDTIRAAAAEATASGAPVVRLVARRNDLGILVVAPVTLDAGGAAAPACLAGEVPSETVSRRIAREADALVAELRLLGVEVVAPDGTAPVVSGFEEASEGAAEPVETWLALPAPLDAWHVHVAAAGDPSAGSSGTLLLAAVVVAAGAIAWGAFALRRTANEQARLAAERQTFLDHVAHEVRTPAGALLALSEELAAGRVPSERQPKYHTHLAEESRRLARLVEDTLDLSRLDAGRLVFERTRTDLREIVAQGLRAAGAEDRVAFRAPGAPVAVLADASAIRRVVRNLADNALRHGGADPKPEVTVTSDGAAARVTVRDHGPGIAADELPRLFERFRRAPSETHETKGVGVGLAICREIARAHGGDVTVSSEPGRGATFTLTLPSAGGGDA